MHDTGGWWSPVVRASWPQVLVGSGPGGGLIVEFPSFSVTRTFLAAALAALAFWNS